MSRFSLISSSSLLALSLFACTIEDNPRRDAGIVDHPDSELILLADQAVTATVSLEGGELVLPSADGAITITVPPLAVFAETEITATPIEALGLDGFVRGVHFDPEGLAFFAPLTVRMPRTDFAFGYRGLGESPYLKPFVVEDDTMVVEVWHFSGVGAGEGPLPATSPGADGDAVEDALAREDEARIESRLAAHWTTVDAMLDIADENLLAYDSAAAAFSEWVRLLTIAGLTSSFSEEQASADPRLSAALTVERDRIIARAVAGADWSILLELVTAVMPRAQVRGFDGEGPLSFDGISSVLPLQAVLADVSLTFDAGQQRYLLQGTSHVVLDGGAPITDPPMDVSATVLGTVEVTFADAATGGAFAIPVTQNRASLTANVGVAFPGLPFDITAATTVSAQNTAPLTVELDATPAVFSATAQTNLTAIVRRGAGPLGLAGEVTFTTSSGACTLGAPAGVPDSDGKLESTLACSASGEVTITASVSHAGDVAAETISVLVSAPLLTGTLLRQTTEHGFSRVSSSIITSVDCDADSFEGDVHVVEPGEDAPFPASQAVPGFGIAWGQDVEITADLSVALPVISDLCSDGMSEQTEASSASATSVVLLEALAPVTLAVSSTSDAVGLVIVDVWPDAATARAGTTPLASASNQFSAIAGLELVPPAVATLFVSMSTSGTAQAVSGPALRVIPTPVN